MLNKSQRITKKKEFDIIFSKGKSRQVEELGVKLLLNDLTLNRFGVIVSNKVSKLAVVRNKTKRRIRASITNLSPKLKIGYDIIVITRPAITNLSAVEIENKLKGIFKILKIVHD